MFLVVFYGHIFGFWSKDLCLFIFIFVPFRFRLWVLCYSRYFLGLLIQGSFRSSVHFHPYHLGFGITNDKISFFDLLVYLFVSFLFNLWFWNISWIYRWTCHRSSILVCPCCSSLLLVRKRLFQNCSQHGRWVLSSLLLLYIPGLCSILPLVPWFFLSLRDHCFFPGGVLKRE